MAAPKGNKNAEVWNEKTVLAAVDRMYQHLQEKPNIYHINALLRSEKLTSQKWSEWTKKFAGNKIVLESLKKVEDALEERIVTDAIKGETNPTMSIFLLKNKYGFKDKQEIDTTIKEKGKRKSIVKKVTIINRGK